MVAFFKRCSMMMTKLPSDIDIFCVPADVQPVQTEDAQAERHQAVVPEISQQEETDKPAVDAAEQDTVQENEAEQKTLQTDVQTSESSLFHKASLPSIP